MPPRSGGSAPRSCCSRRCRRSCRSRTATSPARRRARSAEQSVEIVTDAKVESVDVGADGVQVNYQGGESASFDYLCIAAGRGPDVEGLGLDEAGIELDERGLIEVDGALRTSLDGVYAIGDLVPGPALAHKASDEGVIAAEDAAGLETHPIDYRYVPAATFCHPQVASFGHDRAGGPRRRL